MVEHEINDHPCHGDIKPYWQGPTGDFLVEYELLSQSSRKGDYRHRSHHNRQNCVAPQDKEIHSPNNAFTLESGRSCLKVIG